MTITSEELKELNEREQKLSTVQRLEIRRRFDACMVIVSRAFDNQAEFLKVHASIDEANKRLFMKDMLMYATLFVCTALIFFTSLVPLLAVVAFLFTASFFIQLASRTLLAHKKEMFIAEIQRLYKQSRFLEQEWEIYAPNLPISMLSFEQKNSEIYNENKSLLKRKLLELAVMEWEQFFVGFNFYRDSFLAMKRSHVLLSKIIASVATVMLSRRINFQYGNVR